MTTADHTRRSVVLVACGVAAATVTSALASAARPVACQDDPIHAAISAQREAAALFDAEHAIAAAGFPDADTQPMGAALMSELAAAKALVATVPTTPDGLLALERWLRDGRSRLALHCIEREVAYGNRTATVIGGPEAIDWLIAKHAARLSAV